MRTKNVIFQPLNLALYGLLTLSFIGFSADKAKAVAMNMETGLGALSVNVDTTVSSGIQVRLKNLDPGRVAPQSGGNDYVRHLEALPIASIIGLNAGVLVTSGAGATAGLNGITCGMAAAASAAGAASLTECNTRLGFRTELPSGVIFKHGDDRNFAGNQNNDDGRLNFQNTGDITGATFKVLTEVQVGLASAYGDITFFTRINAFYDPVLHADFTDLGIGVRTYDRGEPGDAGRRDLGKDITLLDASLSWDYDIPAGSYLGTIPISLKIGKLAANNWGEATFSFTGISQGIVLDVPAARRPGAQIKEIIATEFMVYGSVGLPFDIGLDAYYQFHHTPWNLSSSDAPFAISDTPNPSNTAAGYLGLSGGATSGSFRRNCAGGVISAAVGLDPCSTDSITHFANTYYETLPNERAENVRLANGDLSFAKVNYIDADNQGQFGVQLSYYVPFLNGIEFNFSYQNVHSRLPYARIKTVGTPWVALSVIGGASGSSTSALNGLGCLGGSAANAVNTANGFIHTGTFVDPSIKLSQDTVNNTARNFGNEGAAAYTAPIDASSLKLQLDPKNLPGGIRDLIALGAFIDAAPVNVANKAIIAAGGDTSIAASLAANGANRYDVIRINCGLAQIAGALPSAPVGTEYLTLQYNTNMDLYYPQNLKIIGMGFNTTIPWLEWGIQGEVTWRPDTPLQQDVTEQLITHASAQGTGLALGDTAGQSLAAVVTTPLAVLASGQAANWAYADDALGIGLSSRAFNPNTLGDLISGKLSSGEGIIEADMLNITLGTTALYNGSHPIVRLLGADIGIFLIEFNAITFLDDFPEGWDGSSPITRNAATRAQINRLGTVVAALAPLANSPTKRPTLSCIRKSGTELPLGGLVGLDNVNDFSCSPDKTSMGYTILGFLDYNNVFGTAWRIRPSIAIRHGVYGNTPSPLPGWRQDAISVNAGLGFAYQNTYNFSLGYVGYFDVGDHGNYNPNSGLDTFSFNASYAF